MVSPKAARRLAMIATMERIDPEMNAADRIVFSIVTVDSVDGLERMWRELEARADGSFFLSWHWIGCWLRETGLRPSLIVGRLDEKIVTLALVATRHMRRHGWLGATTLLLHETGDPAIDIGFIEYNGFLVDRTLGEAAVARCLGFIIGTKTVGAEEWDELYLGGIPETYIPIVEACGLPLRIVARKPTASIDLAALRAERRPYLDAPSANTRQQIRRAMRLYAARGTLHLDAAHDVAQAMEFFDGLKALHHARWFGRGRRSAFSYPFLERFLRALIARCQPDGTVELLRISVGTEPIGYLYNFVYRGWVGTYLSGFAYEDDPRLKPGLVSYSLCAERHLARGALVQDFLAGDERYKTSLGKPDTTMYWLAVQRPRMRFRLEAALRRLKAMAEGS
jgi:CelD/BcsL family acetyltransferase involved in cellulose biosynthesis